jgi:glucokinase
MEDNRLYLGIDYGGNAAKAGLVDAHGQLMGKASWPTRDMLDKAECRSFANGVSEFVHGLGVYSSEIGGVGLAIPGILAPDSYFVPNVRVDWKMLMQYLSQSFAKVSIETINDANAAALGEMWMGAGTNARSALLVTLGSGLGAGLIVEGTVITGGHGAAGEIGHMTVVPGGRLCKCGREGCIERYASARGIVQTYREAGLSGALDETRFSDFEPESDTDALSVFKAYEVGDPRAEKALSVMADKLGFALAQVACVVDPDVILLGGGMSAGAQWYIDDLRAAYRSYCLESCASTEIRTASLEGDAGIIGAARYAMISVPHDKAQRDWLDPDFGL